MFSCEFSCEHLFYRTSLVAASALKLFKNIAVLSADLEILINTKNLVLKNSSIFFLWLIKLEAVVRRCSVKRVFLEILQNSQENTCARVSFLTKLQASVMSTIHQVQSCKCHFHRCNPLNYPWILHNNYLRAGCNGRKIVHRKNTYFSFLKKTFQRNSWMWLWAWFLGNSYFWTLLSVIW